MRNFFVCIGLLLPVLFYGQDCKICELATKKTESRPLTEFGFTGDTLSNFSVTIFDYRSDTSKLGYDERLGLKKGRKENPDVFFPFRFENGTAKGWSQILSEKMAPLFPQDRQINLAGFLKKFWIYEYDNLYDEKNFEKPFKERQRLVYKADYFFIREGKLYPFARIDTILIARTSKFTDNENVLQQLITLHKEKFSTINPEKVLARNHFTLDFVKEKNELEKYPVLADSVQYAPGVYLSFREFLNNIPGVPLTEKGEVPIEYKKLTKDNHREFAKAWGYSKDNRIYTRLGANFFELVRIGQTFELLGFTRRIGRTSTLDGIATVVSSAATDLPTGIGPPALGISILSLIDATSAKMFFYPMQLDMLTGDVY
jgi:hypothetical protein